MIEASNFKKLEKDEQNKPKQKKGKIKGKISEIDNRTNNRENKDKSCFS